MTKTRVTVVTVVGALIGLLGLLAGCGGVQPNTNGGSPQAAGGGCEESHRAEGAAWQGDRQSDTGTWQPAVFYGQGTGDWQPPTEPYAVGESFTLGDWTIQVEKIDYDATDEVLGALAQRGLSYDGTPIDGWTWVVAQVRLTNNAAAAAASPDAELESRYIDRQGSVYIDFQCGLPDNTDGEVAHGQTATVSFGVPVPPEQVQGGFWGIGPAEDTSVDNLAFVG